MAHEGLDPKRVKKFGFEGNPPADGFISNTFSGEGNPDQGEEYDLDPALEPNKFPRETGSDSFGDIGRSIP